MDVTPSDIDEIIRSLVLTNDSDDELERTVPKPKIRMGPTTFDAKLIRNQFISKAKAHPVTLTDIPLLVKTHKYYGKCQPKQDLLMFISWFLAFGNNIQKALRQSDSIGSSIIRRKCALYGIAIGATSTGPALRRHELNLSRIALAFPMHTATMIMKKKSPGILTASIFFKQELPLLMQHTIFPGLIPAEHFTDDLKAIALILNVEKSVKLSGCKDINLIEETFEKFIEESAKYVDCAINNDINDEQKLKILCEAGILDAKADGQFELAATTAALVNKVEDVKKLYPLRYPLAVRKARINESESISGSDSE